MSIEYFGANYVAMLMQPLPTGWRKPLLKKIDGQWSSVVPCTHPLTLGTIKIEGRGPEPRLAWASMRWQIQGVLP